MARPSGLVSGIATESFTTNHTCVVLWSCQIVWSVHSEDFNLKNQLRISSDLKIIQCVSNLRNVVPECFARLKLETPTTLVWFLCGYRCFTLRLVKVSQREKLLPQFVRKGGTESVGATGVEYIDTASWRCIWGCM